MNCAEFRQEILVSLALSEPAAMHVGECDACASAHAMQSQVSDLVSLKKHEHPKSNTRERVVTNTIRTIRKDEASRASRDANWSWFFYRPEYGACTVLLLFCVMIFNSTDMTVKPTIHLGSAENLNNDGLSFLTKPVPESMANNEYSYPELSDGMTWQSETNNLNGSVKFVNLPGAAKAAAKIPKNGPRE